MKKVKASDWLAGGPGTICKRILDEQIATALRETSKGFWYLSDNIHADLITFHGRAA